MVCRLPNFAELASKNHEHIPARFFFKKGIYWSRCEMSMAHGRMPNLLAIAASLMIYLPCSAAPRRGASSGLQTHLRANATCPGRSTATSQVLRMGRLKLWSEAAECLSALDREASNNLPRDSALCAVAVNTMARLRRPAAAARYLHLMAPLVGNGQNSSQKEAKAPLSALGALLKAYAVTNDLPRARDVLACILAGASSIQAEYSAQHRSGSPCRLLVGPPRGDATHRARKGHGRALSTYLRCCVRSGNMRAAGEALEMFGSAWLHDEICCFLVIDLLCLTLHVRDAWSVACLSLQNGASQGTDERLPHWWGRREGGREGREGREKARDAHPTEERSGRERAREKDRQRERERERDGRDSPGDENDDLDQNQKKPGSCWSNGGWG